MGSTWFWHVPSAKKGQQKVPILNKTTMLCPSLEVITPWVHISLSLLLLLLLFIYILLFIFQFYLFLWIAVDGMVQKRRPHNTKKYSLIWEVVTLFFYCWVWWAWLLINHFPFPLSTFLYCKFMCTCEDPALIACMSPLWQAGFSLVLITFIISPFQSTFVLIGSTDYTALVQCHGSLWSGPIYLTHIRHRLCFKTHQWN